MVSRLIFFLSASCLALVHPTFVPQLEPFSSLYLIAFLALLEAEAG